MTTKKDPKKAEHYVNNKEFTLAVSEFNEKVKLAESKGKTPPRMTEYIGECIYKIATRLSTRPNFINYTYRDEMICDAIENCIQYIGNFNTEKSNNAFAYVTQICYYAFLRRIQNEKKQVFINDKFEARIMLPLSLSYDHRIIDGKDSVGFLVKVKEVLENPEEMVFKGKDPKKILMSY